MFGGRSKKKSSKSSRGGRKSGGPNPEVIAKTFSEFEDGDSGTIGVEGVLALCEALAIDPESDVIALLAFAWKCECAQSAMFTRDEFTKGMTALGCADVAGLKSTLPALRAEVDTESASFKAFYKAAFKLSTEEKQKTLSPEVAAELLNHLIPEDLAFPFMKQFITYITTSEAVRRISFDEWCQFLTFNDSIKPDLSNYDTDGVAFPVLYDEFVEWAGDAGKRK